MVNEDWLLHLSASSGIARRRAGIDILQDFLPGFGREMLQREPVVWATSK